MDILTYVLARNSNGGNGALTSLQDISVDENGHLSFIFENRDPITTTTTIPAATSEQIKDTIINNSDSVKEAIGLPTALEKDQLTDIINNVVTSITIGTKDPETNEQIELKSTDHVLNLPLAQGDIPGLVKGISVSNPEEFDPNNKVHTENVNKIYINNDGTMSIYRVNINRLVQSDDDELIMDGRDSID